MKLTSTQLRQIIKEELKNVLEGGSKKGWNPTMSKEETMENIGGAYSGKNIGLGSNVEKQFIAWLTKNRDLGPEGDAKFSVQELAKDYTDHLLAKKERKLDIGNMSSDRRREYYANYNKMEEKMYNDVMEILYKFGRGSDDGSNNNGTIYYDDVTYNAVRYGLDVPNLQMRAARATNKEPEFQTNPALEESRKRRTKRK